MLVHAMLSDAGVENGGRGIMTNCCNYRAHQLLGIGIENEQRNDRSLGNGEAQCRQGQQGLEAHLGSSVVGFEMILNEPLDRMGGKPFVFFFIHATGDVGV